MSSLLAGWVLLALAGPAQISIEDEFTEVVIAPADMQRIVACNSLHTDLRHKHPQPSDRRDAWRAQREQCSGTGIYEFLLGFAEEQSGDAASARAAFEDAVRRKLPFYERSFIALNSLDAQAAHAHDPPDLRRARLIRDELAGFAEKHPQFPFAYQQLAGQSNGLKDWQAAANYARKTIQLDPASWQARKHLVFALHASEKCAEAVREVRPAIENRGELLADPSFMFPAVDCYAEAGEIATANAALQAFIKKNPAMRDDPRALQLKRFIESKLPPDSRSR